MLTKFYWGTTRKALIIFGNLFNNIAIDRMNSSGEVIQTIAVPITYAPRQKFLARMDVVPDTDRQIEIVLPRMAFEMIGGPKYDSSRKTSSMHRNRKVASATQLNSQYTGVPYNLNVNLYIYAKNQEDALQIVEQILPYFTPDFNFSLKAIPDMDIVQDIAFVLNGADYEDQYEGDFNDRRAVMWTLNFTIKLTYYGPMRTQGVVLTAIANTHITANVYDTANVETVTNIYTEFEI